jgi:thiol-disulfide isomerase/thioredoxin
MTASMNGKEPPHGVNPERLTLPRRRILPVLPLLALGGVAATFLWGINRDPSQLPSTMIGKPVPKFALPAVQGRTLGLSSGDLRGEISLVNIFASWCVACREEHPILMRLAQDRTVPIHGINYKDDPDNAAAWLNAFGTRSRDGSGYECGLVLAAMLTAGGWIGVTKFLIQEHGTTGDQLIELWKASNDCGGRASPRLRIR